MAAPEYSWITDYTPTMPRFVNNSAALFYIDCLDILPDIAPNSIDAGIVDPPLYLSKHQDSTVYYVPGEIYYKQLLQCLKPGAHLVIYCQRKSYHRMACVVEDAGFDLREVLFWLHGQNHTKHSSNTQEWKSQIIPGADPIILARKPFSGTVKSNVQKYGVGGLNIQPTVSEHGDYPNVIHYSSDEVEHEIITTGVPRLFHCHRNDKEDYEDGINKYLKHPIARSKLWMRGYHDYHKPVQFMQWLLRLLVKPGQTIIDPMMGIGSMGVACLREGVRFIGIDKQVEYVDIAEARIKMTIDKNRPIMIDNEVECMN